MVQTRSQSLKKAAPVAATTAPESLAQPSTQTPTLHETSPKTNVTATSQKRRKGRSKKAKLEIETPESEILNASLLSITPFNGNQYRISDALDEAEDGTVRIQFRYPHEKPSVYPYDLYDTIIASLPKLQLRMWEKFLIEFPSGGGFSGYGGLYHQAVSLNMDPPAARSLLGQVAKGFSIVRFLCEELEKPKYMERLRHATNGQQVTVLFWPPAFYTAYPWDIANPNNPSSFFPTHGPYFSTRYNPASPADKLEFTTCLNSQRVRLEKEVDAMEAAQRIV